MPTPPDVHRLFQAALCARGATFQGPDAERCYRIASDRGELLVSLDNLERDVARDAASAAADAVAASCEATDEAVAEALVASFVAAVLAHVDRPDWDVAQHLVYLSAEPADVPLDDAISQRVTDSLCRVLVLTDAEESTVAWLTRGDLATWGVTEATVLAAAGRNLDRLLRDARLEVHEVEGMRLAMLPIASVFKASLVFAPGFKAVAQRDLDWPLLAVAPCRDFLYLLPESDNALLGRLGAVVQREFHTSGYPVTMEVLRLSDDGIEAIGRYAD